MIAKLRDLALKFTVAIVFVGGWVTWHYRLYDLWQPLLPVAVAWVAVVLGLAFGPSLIAMVLNARRSR